MSKSKISRREFLKYSAYTGIAGLLGGFFLLKDNEDIEFRVNYKTSMDRELEKRVQILHKAIEEPRKFTPILSTADLNKLRDPGHYELINDIDLKGVDFRPIGSLYNPSRLTFNGNGYTIRNLKIEEKFQITGGLFLELESSSIIYNLNLEDFEIHGFRCVGGISSNNRGALLNCNLRNGRLFSVESIVGGFFGKNQSVTGLISPYSGIIENCSLDNVDIQGGRTLGGFCGINENGSLLNSSFHGNLRYLPNVYSPETGLLVGLNSGGHIVNCKYSGKINEKKSRKKVGAMRDLEHEN